MWYWDANIIDCFVILLSFDWNEGSYTSCWFGALNHFRYLNKCKNSTITSGVFLVSGQEVLHFISISFFTSPFTYIAFDVTFSHRIVQVAASAGTGCFEMICVIWLHFWDRKKCFLVRMTLISLHTPVHAESLIEVAQGCRFYETATRAATQTKIYSSKRIACHVPHCQNVSALRLIPSQTIGQFLVSGIHFAY